MGKKSIISVVFAFLGLCVISFVSFKAFQEAERNKQIEKEIGAIRSEAEKIRSDNRELEEKIAYFQTPEFQEKVAKEKLNFQKADEEVVIIKSSPSLRAEEELKSDELIENGSKEERVSNYRKWWRYFFGY